MEASSEGNLQTSIIILYIVVFLIKHKASISQIDNNNWCAIHYAANNGKLAAIACLNHHGALLDCETVIQDTPLLLALQNKFDIVY